LRERIEERLATDSVSLEVTVPYSQQELVALFRERGQVAEEEYRPEGVYLKGRLPRRFLYAYTGLERRPS
jgi:50S ribosomal subunit-associated GTPase HflX